MQSSDFGICFNNWFVDIRSYLIFSIRLHALEWTKDRLHQNLEYKSHFTGEQLSGGGRLFKKLKNERRDKVWSARCIGVLSQGHSRDVSRKEIS